MLPGLQKSLLVLNHHCFSKVRITHDSLFTRESPLMEGKFIRTVQSHVESPQTREDQAPQRRPAPWRSVSARVSSPGLSLPCPSTAHFPGDDSSCGFCPSSDPPPQPGVTQTPGGELGSRTEMAAARGQARQGSCFCLFKGARFPRREVSVPPNGHLKTLDKGGGKNTSHTF